MMPPTPLPPRASERGLIGCHGCGLVCEADARSHADCPRCGAALHARRPNAISRATALLVAALVFYIPANLVPVMSTNLLGHASESTILEGVVEFWASGSYDIALVIFIASVGVPCTKFLALGTLFLTSARRSPVRMRERARMYRLVERIGYWSMLDVLVVAVVAALVKFGSLGDIEPRPGILFFGVVVILTMLSSMSFDPRLIWDAHDPTE